MKNLGKIKDLLSREEMKQIQGGSGGQDSTNAWVSCGNGAMFKSYGCGSYADSMCANHSGFSSCSQWDW
jgi:hypothetical protein